MIHELTLSDLIKFSDIIQKQQFIEFNINRQQQLEDESPILSLLHIFQLEYAMYWRFDFFLSPQLEITTCLFLEKILNLIEQNSPPCDQIAAALVAIENFFIPIHGLPEVYCLNNVDFHHRCQAAFMKHPPVLIVYLSDHVFPLNPYQKERLISSSSYFKILFSSTFKALNKNQDEIEETSLIDFKIPFYTFSLLLKILSGGAEFLFEEKGLKTEPNEVQLSILYEWAENYSENTHPLSPILSDQSNPYAIAFSLLHTIQVLEIKNALLENKAYRHFRANLLSHLSNILGEIQKTENWDEMKWEKMIFIAFKLQHQFLHFNFPLHSSHYVDTSLSKTLGKLFGHYLDSATSAQQTQVYIDQLNEIEVQELSLWKVPSSQKKMPTVKHLKLNKLGLNLDQLLLFCASFPNLESLCLFEDNLPACKKLATLRNNYPKLKKIQFVKSLDPIRMYEDYQLF